VPEHFNCLYNFGIGMEKVPNVRLGRLPAFSGLGEALEENEDKHGQQLKFLRMPSLG